MGVDLRYQGLPPGCGFIELVRSRTWADSSWVSAARHWLQWGASVRGERIKPAPGQKPPYPDEPEAELVWTWCCEAVERFPDLPQRSLDMHKSYRWLPFVLSATVRKRLRWPKPGPTDPRSWNDPESGFDQLAEQAFEGAPQIAPDVRGSQGLPIRLIERSTTNNLGLCLAAIERDEISPRISELVELDMLPAWDADLAMKIFTEFQQFFAEAALRGEDVLVIWD